MFTEYEKVFYEVLSDVIPPLKSYKIILKNQYGKDIIDNNENVENENIPDAYELSRPISSILENISDFNNSFTSSFYYNIKFFLQRIEQILP